MVPNRQSLGFTLIELLVVMAIIATLAGLGIVGVPMYLRQGERLKCKDNLSQIHKALFVYETENKQMPRASGAAFPLAVWGRQIDKTAKNAEVFFCPSTKRRPDPDLSNVTPGGIDFTGPDLSSQSGRRNGLSISSDKASDTVIVCNKVPDPNDAQSEEDRRANLPHHGKGICVLYLNGGTDFIDASDFPDDLPVIGRDSPMDKLKWMVPGFQVD